jgi:hypothetical protein
VVIFRFRKLFEDDSTNFTSFLLKVRPSERAINSTSLFCEMFPGYTPLFRPIASLKKKKNAKSPHYLKQSRFKIRFWLVRVLNQCYSLQMLKSKLWNHFIKDVVGHKVTCKHCNSELTIYAPGSTSGFKKHLILRHGIDIADEKGLKRSRSPSPPNEESEKYTVEKIVDKRVWSLSFVFICLLFSFTQIDLKTKRPEYLVKWKGYPADENTWEPLECFEDNAPVEEFEEKTRQEGAIVCFSLSSFIYFLSCFLLYIYSHS